MKDVIRILSTGAIISSQAFGKLTAAKQTEALATANSAGTIVFVENFISLRNMKKLRERLLAGEDVAMELEFNEIKLTKDEISAIEAVRPVLQKLDNFSLTEYQWATDSSQDKNLLKGFRYLNDASKYTPNNNWFYLDDIKKVWKAASEFWFDGTPPSSNRIKTTAGIYDFSITEETVTIGCETFTRGQVEAIARRFKLPAPKGE